MRCSVAKLVVLGLLALAAGAQVAWGAPRAGTGRAFVEDTFVRAANRGDYATVCRLYSRHYLKISQRACRSLYRSDEVIFGPYDYRVVRRRTLPNGHRRADLVLRHHPSFVEFARERGTWRLVAGGF
jgi:hypothetical protein